MSNRDLLLPCAGWARVEGFLAIVSLGVIIILSGHPGHNFVTAKSLSLSRSLSARLERLGASRPSPSRARAHPQSVGVSQGFPQKIVPRGLGCAEKETSPAQSARWLSAHTRIHMQRRFPPPTPQTALQKARHCSSNNCWQTLL